MHSTNATQPISQYYRNGYGDIPPRLHVLMAYSISSINIPFDWIYAEAFEQLVPTTPSSFWFVVVFATRLIDLIELIEPWNGDYDYSSHSHTRSTQLRRMKKNIIFLQTNLDFTRSTRSVPRLRSEHTHHSLALFRSTFCCSTLCQFAYLIVITQISDNAKWYG